MLPLGNFRTGFSLNFVFVTLILVTKDLASVVKIKGKVDIDNQIHNFDFSKVSFILTL